MGNIEGKYVRYCIFVIITSLLFTLFTIKVINNCKTKDDNMPITRTEEIKEALKDSITVITIKENEEIKIVRDADNDSTLIIFKRLVSE